jgi:nucleoside-diphosphate-sugar epimerase
MKRVLLTGATGFLGRHAVAALRARDYAVACVSARPGPPGAGTRGVTWHQADLLDAGARERLVGTVRPTHLLHLAWYAVPGAFWRSPENVRWVEASLALVRAFAAAGGRRVAVAGTAAEYAADHGRCVEDETPLRPTSLYGASKHALHTVLAPFAAETGLSLGWGRLFLLYGPHEDRARLVASVITTLLEGGTARCTHGEQMRDFLHARDAAEALVALLDSPVEGAVNVGSGVPVALRDLVLRIADLLDGRPRVALGALPPRAAEPPVLYADVTRLTREVGWRPRLDLEAGLRDTIAWWREAHRPTAVDQSGGGPGGPGGSVSWALPPDGIGGGGAFQ